MKKHKLIKKADKKSDNNVDKMLIKWAEKEIKEWQKFIKLVKEHPLSLHEINKNR